VAALPNNQLSGYGYDAAGNMTHDATTGNNYNYDAENRIIGAAGYTYIYDADGNRVEKSNGSTGTIYWYMTPGIVAESDLAGNLQSEYVFFDGERVARKDFPSGAVSYYFSDHLKTASVITDAAGNIKEDEDYYPWGGELQFVNNDSNHYKFTGKERDAETVLDYFGARYYSNGLGRFITPDWAAKPAAVPYAVLGDPQTLNLYTYVRNIPTSQIDKDGHCPPCSVEDWSNGRIWVDPASGIAIDLGDPNGNMKAAGLGLAGGVVLAGAAVAPEVLPGAGIVLRNLLGVGVAAASTPAGQNIINGVGEAVTNPLPTVGPSAVFNAKRAIGNFGFKAVEKAGSTFVGQLATGAKMAVNVGMEGAGMKVSIPVLSKVSAETLRGIESGAINAAKGEGATSVTITAKMVGNMAKTLVKQGFQQVFKDGKATSDYTKTIKIPQ
jgi:RHS repeat-associated protein